MILALDRVVDELLERLLVVAVLEDLEPRLARAFLVAELRRRRAWPPGAAWRRAWPGRSAGRRACARSWTSSVHFCAAVYRSASSVAYSSLVGSRSVACSRLCEGARVVAGAPEVARRRARSAAPAASASPASSARWPAACAGAVPPLGGDEAALGGLPELRALLRLGRLGVGVAGAAGVVELLAQLAEPLEERAAGGRIGDRRRVLGDDLRGEVERARPSRTASTPWRSRGRPRA